MVLPYYEDFDLRDALKWLSTDKTVIQHMNLKK